jgi:hypothetical protein
MTVHEFKFMRFVLFAATWMAKAWVIMLILGMAHDWDPVVPALSFNTVQWLLLVYLLLRFTFDMEVVPAYDDEEPYLP